MHETWLVYRCWKLMQILKLPLSIESKIIHLYSTAKDPFHSVQLSFISFIIYNTLLPGRCCTFIAFIMPYSWCQANVRWRSWTKKEATGSVGGFQAQVYPTGRLNIQNASKNTPQYQSNKTCWVGMSDIIHVAATPHISALTWWA